MNKMTFLGLIVVGSLHQAKAVDNPQYKEWTGLGLSEFAELNPDWPMRALLGTVLEWNRDAWVAAGKFWRQYEEVTVLQGAGGAPALDAYHKAFNG